MERADGERVAEMADVGRAAAATQVKVEKPAFKDTTPAAGIQDKDEETPVAEKVTQGGPTWRGRCWRHS